MCDGRYDRRFILTEAGLTELERLVRATPHSPEAAQRRWPAPDYRRDAAIRAARNARRSRRPAGE